MTSTQIAMLVVAFILFLFSIICALAETSFVRTNVVRAIALEKEGRRGASKLRKMHEQPETTLNILLLVVLISQLGTASIISVVVEDQYGGVGVAISLLIQITLFFVIGEVAPKTYAVQNPDKVVLAMTPFLWLITAFAPLRWISKGLIAVSNLLLPGRGIKEGPFVTENDLKTMASVAAEEASIEEEERELIHSIFDFTDSLVREVMQPRTDMTALSDDTTITEALTIAIEAGFSRIPVFHDTYDHISGIIYLKDLVENERIGRGNQKIETVQRTAVFIPEQKRTAELLRDMQQGQFHMAIVVDEYGGTAGLITLEDLIEEVFGEIVDEYDSIEPTIVEIGESKWRVPGRTSISDLKTLLDIELPDTQWDTVSGLVFNVCQHVPYEGERVYFDVLEFLIERVQGQRIVTVQVTKNEPEEPEETSSNSNESKKGDAGSDYLTKNERR